ncbi:transposase [Actinomadura opuntiae]|uniref:transposase n=1 Tax=Actinomadura sp. OS1-43 TaxID=604315 RepID=UPI00333E95B7
MSCGRSSSPLIPGLSPKPQGGGTASLDERLVLIAIVYMLTSGCTWRQSPGEFGITRSTAHRRFAAWTRMGCGRGCTAPCWTSWAAAARSTGSARSWTPPPSRRKWGHADRPQSGRLHYEGQ